jgi:hypothetical protein
MRQPIFGVLACTTIIAIGGAAYALQAAQYRNVPGPITGSYAGGIAGTFHLEAAIGDNGIPSNGDGGACIVFRAKDIGDEEMDKIRCSNDSQCSTPAHPYGYCEQPNNKCWAKPSGSDPKVCKKGVAMVPGAVHTISVSKATLTQFNIPHNAKARVLTRLNCASPACGPNGESFVLEWGTDKQL